MARTYKIFIVEDEPIIAKILQEHLTTWGFTTKIASDFQNILGEITAFKPDLILLDISLPCYNGYYWCQKIRDVVTTPIIFISSADEPANMIMAMNMGADDFISKPFEIAVVSAKIQALLRRNHNYQEDKPTSYQFKALYLDSEKMQLRANQQIILLTKNE
ncbi:MAG: response regulator, partial [Culicoidibacterales bacterium]